ncbi:MAG: LacI family DNA-binding transcriptional regulator [Puniceicoccales bacterium]
MDTDSNVTIRQIASHVGLHYSTVSLALRDSPKIAEETRHRVKLAAQELGYRVNPMFSALSSYRRKQRPASFQSTIAVLSDDFNRYKLPPNNPWSKNVYDINQQALECMTRRAASRGFKIDLFDVSSNGYSPSALRRILISRGIEHVILLPFQEVISILPVDLSGFAVVAIGYTVESPNFHRVAIHQFENMRRHLQVLRSKGYHKIGLQLRPSIDARTKRHWRAAYTHDAEVHKTPHALFETQWLNGDRSCWEEWYHKYKPQALICDDYFVKEIAATGITFPSTLFLSGLTVGGNSFLAGWDELSWHVYEESVDRVISLHRLGRGNHIASEGAPILLITGRYQDSPIESASGC